MLSTMKLLMIITMLSLMITNTQAALCATASSTENQCKRCYQGYLDENNACKDPATPLDNCGYYKDEKTCISCEPRFVKIIEATDPEIEGQCIPSEIKNCIHGVKRIEGHFCFTCDTGYIPSLNQKECLLDEDTFLNIKDHCAWNSHHGCRKCAEKYAFEFRTYVVRYVYLDGKIREKNLHQSYYSSKIKWDRTACHEYPTVEGYDWTGTTIFNTKIIKVRTQKEIDSKSTQRWWWRKRYTWVTSELTEYSTSSCDVVNGYHQDKFGAPCVK